MNILLTFDYELFFGARSGTPERCLFAPVGALLEVLDRHGAKACFFVDAGYLFRLREERPAAAEYRAVADHVAGLARQGHDVQLHIHPHWRDAVREGRQWRAAGGRFRLHDFPDDEIPEVVAGCADAVREVAGGGIFAFRAGGWCLQPFDRIREALRASGVWLDSTVYAGGFGASESHWYDFRGAPGMTAWRFSDDPLRSDTSGEFVEVPISSLRVGPAFFWRFAAAKKLLRGRHRAFGDGTALLAGGRASVGRMLLRGSDAVVSVDGYRSSLLERAFRRHLRRFPGPGENFVVIGHPKALTPYSLEHLDRFLAEHSRRHRVTIYRDLKPRLWPEARSVFDVPGSTS